MSEYIVNKKSPQIILIILLFFGLFYFFYFKSTEAQVCTGYLVWPGTWEPGRMPMASNQQYVLTGSPIYVSGSNVGIGTRSPVYTFQVNGDISGTRLCIGSDCRSVWPEGGGGGGGITGSGVSGQVTFWTGSTSVGGDNNLFWNNLNKRLGIGTTTPQTSLHVVGNITANSFLGTINAANISSGQFGANTGGGNYSFPGNVGIGTTAPAYKLDIVGALRLQPSSAPIGANGVIYYDSTANKFKCFENGAWKDCIGAGGGGFWAASGANIYNTNTGNVGIGTTAPGYKLDIVGALRLQPSSVPIGANGVIYYDSTANKFKCFENGAWKDCISAGGIPSGAYIAFPDSNPRTGFTYTGVIENIEGWTTKASMPTPRERLATAVVNNIIYTIGGYSDITSYLSTNEAYDPATNSWTTKASMPTRRDGFGVAVVNNIIYAIGGCGVNCPPVNENVNEAYDPSTDTWTTKAPMPTRRADLAAAVVNNIIYAIGGFTTFPDLLNPQVIPVNEAYDPSTDTWTTKAPMPTPRAAFAAAVVNNIIYTIGGDSTSTNFLSTNEAYDPSTDTWTTKAPMPTGRSALAAAVLNNKIYAIGGFNGNPLSTNEAYDPSTNTWTAKTPMPTPRYNLAAAVVNNKIYAIGGRGVYSQLSTNEAYPFVLTLYWFQKQ